MKIRQLYLFLLVLLVSCKSAISISEVKPSKNISITDQFPEQVAMQKIIAPYKAQLEIAMNTKIAHTNVELNKSGDNSNLGNLLADFTYLGAETWAKLNNLPSIDAAVINIGGVRSIIGAGDILTKNVYEVMPFENEVVIVKMEGKDVQGLFDYYAKTQKNNPVSHLIITTDYGKITQQLIDGKPLQMDKTYYIATSDYLASGGDSMFYFSKGSVIATGIKMRDLFIEKFKENPEVIAPTDIRLTFKNIVPDNE